MLTISKPPVGAIAFGRSGVGCIIEALEADRILLKTPSGLKRVPLDAVIRWELPKVPTIPTPGDRVRLQGTTLEYTLTELYEVVYWIQGEHSTETWARLKTDDGAPAHWKCCQLEVLL